jgi:type I restriction enzyme S subunit
MLKSEASGAVQSFVSLGVLRSFVIALPPLSEQHRIVAKVDELMALCDQLEQQTESSLDAHNLLVDTLLASLLKPAEGSLTDARDANELSDNWARLADHFDTLITTDYAVEQLKQTILQLAVMGKLVPQDPNDEPASELLKRIAVEKEQLIKDKKIKKQKPLPKISDEEKPFELSDGWEYARLGLALKKITDGTHHSPTNGESGDFLYISAKNIKNHGVQLSNATWVEAEVHEEIYSRCDPEFGDILYIKDGATTGIVTINNLKEPFSMLSSVALLKCTAQIFNEYLLLALRSPLFYEEMRAGMTGVAITRVTLKKLDNAFIPLPPLDEQKRIVEKVDELMTLCDKLKVQLNDAQTTQLHLADAVVGEALN